MLKLVKNAGLFQLHCVRIFLFCLFISFASGCETIGFYGQAITGQLSLLAKRQDIDRVLRDETADSALKERLILVQSIRHFASESLALPVGKSYSSYVDLHRDVKDNFIVWNVFAAPEFSLEPHEWCYPLIGCAHYRGYFSRQAAERFAETLHTQGLESYVGAVKAYSTLGWFADPVLSTFVHFDDTRLAALLFHELAHKVVYIRNDTEFNESFASAVETEALNRWLSERQQLNLLSQRRVRKAAQAEFIERVNALRIELGQLYSAVDVSPKDQREQKHELFARLQQNGSQMHSLGFRRRLQQLNNNASLVPVHSYNRWQSAFAQLLSEHGGEFPAFFSAVKRLGDLPVEQRQLELQKLTDKQAQTVQKLTNESI